MRGDPCSELAALHPLLRSIDEYAQLQLLGLRCTGLDRNAGKPDREREAKMVPPRRGGKPIHAFELDDFRREIFLAPAVEPKAPCVGIGQGIRDGLTVAIAELDHHREDGLLAEVALDPTLASRVDGRRIVAGSAPSLQPSRDQGAVPQRRLCDDPLRDDDVPPAQALERVGIHPVVEGGTGVRRGMDHDRLVGPTRRGRPEGQGQQDAGGVCPSGETAPYRADTST